MPPLFPPRRASELAILPIVRDRGCQSLADDPVRAVEVRLPAGLCTSTVGSDIEVQHLRRNIGPVMAIALSVEQSRIGQRVRSEEHTSELQSLMRISYAVFCLNKNTSTLLLL